MRCSETQEKIITYLEGSLTEKEQRSFMEHIAKCESCRQELEHAREMDSLLKQQIPAYYREIQPAPDFVARLQNTGPWNTPAKPASGLWQWLFAPWQSRRIVAAALSAALIVSLALLGPRAYMMRESTIPAPPGITSSESAKDGSNMTSSDNTESPSRMNQSDSSGTATKEALNTTTPSSAPSATTTNGFMSTPTPAPAPTSTASLNKSVSLISMSGNGYANSAPLAISSSPWQLQWSVTSGPNDIIMEIFDSQTKIKLGEMTNNLTAPGTLDNATTVYNRTGNLYLVIKAPAATYWQVQVIPAP